LGSMNRLYTLGAILIACFTAHAQQVTPTVKKITYHLDLLNPATRSVIDTVLSGSQYHHPLYAYDVGWIELGHLASPAMTTRYHGLSNFFIPPMLAGFQHYLETDSRIIRYQTATPFSLLNYNAGGAEDKNGLTARVIYTRNLSPFANLTAQMRFDKADGHYKNQAASLSTYSIHYSIQKPSYKLYARYAQLSAKQGENGGVTDDGDLARYSRTIAVPVSLTQARSNTRITSLKGIQEFDLTVWPVKSSSDTLHESSPKQLLPFKLQHRFEIESSGRVYKDPQPLSDFYPDVLLDSVQTNDSIHLFRVDQQFLILYDRLKIQKQPLVIQAGIRPVGYRYTWVDRAKSGFDLGVVSRFEWCSNRNRWMADFEFTATGTRRGDHLAILTWQLSLPVGTDTSLLELTFRSEGVTPNFFWQTYYSNHWSWDRNFTRQTGQSLMMEWSFPDKQWAVTLKASIVSGYLYFNTDALPDQLHASFPVAEATLRKSFHAGPFHSRFDLTGQYTPAEQLPLPALVAFNSTYLHHDLHFKSTGGMLELEYGWDFRYFTGYRGYAYRPATGIFYLQNERMLGYYPMVSLFAQVKIKRTRIFVQYNHLLGFLLKEDYFPALHYPYPEPYFKYGLYWHFYD